MERFTSTLALLATRVRDLWAAQSLTNRLLAGAFAVALVAGIAVFGAFRLKGPEYGVLFSNLSADEANGVVAKLNAENVPHRLANNGTTVLVPQEKVADERVALAGTGVVKGGSTGFELFDRTNLGMTDFQEKIAKVRATEGELQRTISSLTPVESARVHLAQPEATLYSSTQSPTTASIAIKTKPGMQLSPEEVRGVTLLTTGAVEGLKPENVTIVNQDGNVLVPSAVGSEANNPLAAQASALKLTQDQLLAKQRWEANLQSNVQGLLDDAIGNHRSAVRVAADMNFDANQVEAKTYGPTQVRSSQNERESFNGTGQPPRTPQGVPGTTTNAVPTYQANQQQNTNSKYTRSKATVNNEVNEQKTMHVDAPGKVTRLSVAVLVNVPAAAAAPPAAGAAPAYSVSAADVAKIRNVVAAAAGIDPARGDQISVEAIPFAPLPSAGLRGGTTTIAGIPVVVLIVLGILALLGVAAAGAFLLRGRAGVPMGGGMAGGELPTFDSTLAEELPSFEEHPMLDGGSPALAAPIRSAADLTREQMIEYVTTVAQENPDSIAKLIKLWLAEA